MTDPIVSPARARGPWSAGEPDAPPSCPGCGRELSVSQPDPARPDDLLGCCLHPPCGEWVILRRRGGAVIPAERIPRERIRARYSPRPAIAAASVG